MPGYQKDSPNEPLTRRDSVMDYIRGIGIPLALLTSLLCFKHYVEKNRKTSISVDFIHVQDSTQIAREVNSIMYRESLSDRYPKDSGFLLYRREYLTDSLEDRLAEKRMLEGIKWKNYSDSVRANDPMYATSKPVETQAPKENHDWMNDKKYNSRGRYE